MTTIDPTTCKPGAYRVRIGDHETDALCGASGIRRWVRQTRQNAVVEFLRDSEVTVLHRLVPEPEEKTLDVPMQPWDALRAAADLVESAYGAVPAVGLLMRLADRLEAEHRAAQAKAEQDDRRREIAAEAIDAYKSAVRAEYGENPVDAIPFESGILAVVDTVRAAVLAEAVQP